MCKTDTLGSNNHLSPPSVFPFIAEPVARKVAAKKTGECTIPRSDMEIVFWATATARLTKRGSGKESKS